MISLLSLLHGLLNWPKLRNLQNWHFSKIPVWASWGHFDRPLTYWLTWCPPDSLHINIFSQIFPSFSRRFTPWGHFQLEVQSQRAPAWMGLSSRSFLPHKVCGLGLIQETDKWPQHTHHLSLCNRYFECQQIWREHAKNKRCYSQNNKLILI